MNSNDMNAPFALSGPHNTGLDLRVDDERRGQLFHGATMLLLSQRSGGLAKT
jgi:hypothetical protein